MSGPSHWDSDPGAGAMDSSRSINPLQVLFAHKWIVVFGLLLGLGLAHLVYTRQIPVYQSSARLLFVKRNNRNMPVDMVSSALAERDDHILTHIMVIRSPLVIGRAVQDFKLGELPSLAGSPNPVGSIAGGLGADIAAINDSFRSKDVIDLSYQCGNPSDCGKILLAIIESYDRILEESTASVSVEAIDLIQKAGSDLTDDISRQEAALAEFLEGKELLADDGTVRNPHESRVAEIEQARSTLVIQRAGLASRIDAIETALTKGARREAILIMLDDQASEKGSAMGEGMQSMLDRLFPLLLDEQILIENFGADHPEVKAVRKKIEMTREFIREHSAGDIGLDAAGPQDMVDIYLEALHNELAMLDDHAAKLNQEFERELLEAKRVGQDHAVYRQRAGELQRSIDLFEATIKRLNEITLIKEEEGSEFKMSVLSPPGVGGKVYPVWWMTFAAGGFFGLMLGYGLGYVIELADRSFRSPDEIRRQVGVTVLGHVPLIEDSKRRRGKMESPIDATLSTFHRPKSHAAEAYRAVRTSLFFAAGSQSHRVIQITSPLPGDGKTTLAGNLAISIAQSGRKVLLIDADFRRPRVHKLFGIDVRYGLSSVIAGKTDLEGATYLTQAPNLWCMPCGPTPHNPSELLTSPEFEEVLTVVREKYDFVIIDSPPLLAVSDPGVVAARVDGVILTTRLNKRTRAGLSRSVEVMRGLGAEIIGIVVNGIGQGAQYGYGRGYGGRYDYSYDYGYREPGRSYYTDDTEAGAEAEQHRLTAK